MKGVSLSKKAEQERFRLLYAPLISNQIIGSFAVTVLMLLLFSQQVSIWLLLLWVVIALASIAYHIYLYLNFKPFSSNQDFAVKEWEHKFLLGVGVLALVWGAACLLLYVNDSVSHQNYLALIVAGIGVVAVRMYSPSHKAMIIYSVVAIIPLIITVFISGSVVAIPLVGYLLFQIGISYANGIKFKHDSNSSQSLQYAAKQRELKLTKSDERYRLWFKNSEDPMLLLIPEKIMKANRAAVKLLGYDSAAQLLKVKPAQLVADSDELGGITSKLLGRIKQELKASGSSRFECMYINKASNTHPAEVTLTAIPFKSQQAYFCVFRDITESQSIISELRQGVSQSKAENRAKSEFYTHISQAVFTPMNGVLGHTNLLLQKNDLSPDQMMRARVIKRSAETLFNTFNDVLDVTQIEAGNLQLSKREFDMQVLLDSFIEDVTERTKAQNISFKHHIDPNMYRWYKGDADRIVQILENLFSNALKFTDKGSITLIAKMVKDNQAGAIWRFDLIDTGPGVSQGQQTHLFDRFTQADGTASGKIGSTGLGLNLCQGLSRLMGGEIGYTDQKRKGAHFWFTIKLLKTAEIKIPKAKLKPKQKGIKAFDAKVLVVDDNRTSLLVAKGTLEVFCLDIDLVNSGVEAIAALQKEDYDLVFMDCLMPHMDGYQTTAKIREISSKVRNHAIPIIAMTSNDQEGDREICIDAGMNDYITKPIDIRVIQQMLQFWIMKKQPKSLSN